MADFSLVVDLDVGASTSNFQRDISRLVGQLNAKPPKIKVEIYNDHAVKQIAEIRKELESLSLAASATGAGNVGGFAAQMQQAGKTLEGIKTQLDSIAEVSKNGGFANGFKDAIPVIDNLKAELASLSKAMQEFQGFSLNLKLGGGSTVGRNSEYGSSARSAITELKQQAQAIEAVINEVYPLINGKGGLGSLLQGQGALTSRLVGVRDVFRTKNLSLSAEMDAWREYVAILKEAAALKGVDISSATSGFAHDANDVVAATEKIRSGEAQLSQEAEKIKSIFGSGIGSEALESHLNTINTSILSVTEAIAQLGTNSNAFEELKNSITEVTTAINGLLEELGRVDANAVTKVAEKAKGTKSPSVAKDKSFDKDLASMNASLVTFQARLDEVHRKYSNLKAPSTELTASYERLSTLMQTMTSANATTEQKVAAYREWGAAVKVVNALLTSVGNAERQSDRESAAAAKEAAAAAKEEAAAEKERAAAAEAAAKAKAAADKKSSPVSKDSKEYLDYLTQIDRKLAEVRANEQKWTAAKNGKTSENYADYVRQAAALEELAADLRNGSISADEFKARMAGINQVMASNAAAIKGAGEATKSLSDRFSGLAGKFASWFSVSQVIMYLWRGIKDMVSASIELEDAFAQLKIVTGASDAEMQQFKTTAVDLSTQLGQSVADVTKSIETFSRLGYSLPDASALAEYATILANVAAVSPDEATTGLTSIIKGFNLNVSDAEHVADVLVEVGQKYAVSASEMMEAYEKSGAALNATNTSFEKSAGLIAAANAAVQDASVVGTALKTVSARIRGSKADLDELGESTDDLAEGFSKYADEIKSLTGFDIMLDDHTFKDLYDIMEGIAGVWDKLSDTQQARVAEILGGTRQLQVISSILGNWGDAAGAYETAMNSAGAATKANDIYMETATAHINQFKSAFAAMSQEIVNSSVLTWFIDLGTHIVKIISGISKVVNAIAKFGNGIIPKVVLLSTAIAKIGNVLQNGLPLGILTKIASLWKLDSVQKMTAMAKQFVSTFNAFKPLTGTLRATASGLKAVWSSMSSFGKFSTIASGVLIGIELIRNAIDRYKQKKNEAFESSINRGKEASQEAENLSQLYADYENAKQAYDLNTGSKEALTEATLRLAEALGLEKDAIDGVGDGFDDLTLQELEKARQNAEAAVVSQQQKMQDAIRGTELGGNAGTLIAMIGAELGMGDVTKGSSEEVAERLIKIYDRLIERRQELKEELGEDSQQYLINEQAISDLGPYISELLELRDALSGIEEQIADINGETTNSDVVDSRMKARTDAVRELLNALRDADKLSLLNLDENKIIAGLISGTLDIDTSQINTATELVREFGITLSEAYDTVTKLGDGIDGSQLISLAKTLASIGSDGSDAGRIFGRLSDRIGTFAERVLTLNDLGYDINDSIVGNVTHGAIVQEVDGIPVAFTPVFKTEDGTGKIINGERLAEYVRALFAKAGDDLSKENILRLDAEGIMLNGVMVKNIIADIGDTAYDSAEATHLLFDSGGISVAYQNLDSYAKKFGLSADTILDYVGRFSDFKLDINVEKTGIEAFNKAVSESATSTGVAADSVAALTSRYEKLESFDPNRLFETTSQGIHLNAQALREYEAEYEASNRLMAESNLRSLAAEYEVLTAQINNATDLTDEEIVSINRRRDAVLQEIHSMEAQIAQYYNLTSAYNKWLAAKQQGDDRDAYSAVGSSYKEVKELMDAGWINDKEVNAYLDLMLSASQRTGDNVRDFQKLTETIEGTGYAVVDFFTLDSNGKITTDGLANFLDAIRIKSEQLGESFVTVGEDGRNVFDLTGDNLEKVANMLGISTELVEIFAKALSDAGWDVKFDDMFADINARIEGAMDSVSNLKEMKANGEIEAEVDFNVNVESIEEADAEIARVNTLLDELKEKNGGTLDINDEAVRDALTVLNGLLAAKRQLELNQSTIMHVDLTTNQGSNIGTAITLLQEFRVAYADLQTALARQAAGEVDVDVAGAQQKVDDLFAKISANETITKKIGIDPSSADEVASQIDAITGDEGAQLLIDLGIGQDEITNFIADNSNPTINFSETHTEVDTYLSSLNNITKTITFKAKGPSVLGGFLSGIVGAQGTAHAHGTWGVSKDEDALVGELGPEMIVRGGRFFTVGANSAEITHLRRGDIIFNAEQTRQILKNGNITNGVKRGISYATGSAYAGRVSGASLSGSVDRLRTGVSVTNAAGNAIGRNGNYANIAAVQAKQAAKVASEALEEQLKNLKEEIDDILAQFEFDIFMAEKQKKSSAEIIAIYKKMQETVHNQAEKYRSMGVDENNQYIRDLKKQWWEYEEAIRKARKDEFDEWIKDSQFIIEAMTHDEEGVDKIIESWRTILKSINDEIDYYTSQGYDITSDEIQDLLKEAWDAEQEIEDILGSVLDKINEDIDHIQDVFKTLRTAAEEWNSSQFLTLDTLQDIIDLGVEYMACLKEENGMLVINREAIADMLAAKAKELAVEAGLNYVRRIGLALADNQTEELNRLLYATQDATDATWGLVYANLAFLKLTDQQRDAALRNLDKMRSLAENVSQNILNSLNEEDGPEALEKSGDALKTILDYTKDLIRHEHDDVIDALDDQLEKYKDIIDKKKESLALTKSELEYNKDIADRTKEISKLQAQIDALALDDSREAQLKRAKLMEELAQKQEDLEEKQRDHAYEIQTDALDKQSEDFEKLIDERKEAIENEISSEEKLYQLALKRMQETEWTALKDQLLAWNEEYGSSLNSEIVESWESATRAVEQYGSVLDALNGSGITEDGRILVPDIVGIDHTYNGNEYDAIAKEMQANSLKWYGANDTERKKLENRNAELASKLTELGAYRENGTWYRSDGSQLYALDENQAYSAIVSAMKQNSLAWFTASDADRAKLAKRNQDLAGMTNGRITSKNGEWVDSNGKLLYTISASEKEAIAKTLVAMMKQNSAAWSSASASEQTRLANENVRLANTLEGLLGTSVTNKYGDWYINGKLLYDVYHKGGVVGGGTSQARERFALLQDNEWVLAEDQIKSLERLLSVGQMLRDKSSLLADSIFNGMIDNIAARPIRSISGSLPSAIEKPAQVVQVDASLTVSGVVDDDVLRVIKRYPREVAEQVSKVLL